MSDTPSCIPKASLLGVPISLVDLPAAVEYLAGVIGSGRREYVCTCPAYTVMLGRDDPAVGAAIRGAGLAAPDGMGVVWALERLGHRVGRVYGPDLLLALCERGLTAGWRHYFYGGGPRVAEAVEAALAARYPGLQVAGGSSPPFRALSPEEEKAEAAALNAARPDIVWVGLGSPKQDLWCASHRAALQAPLLIGVGAAFDFVAGRVRQAPRFLQVRGLEWVFRLAMEPRRLWRRYLVYNPRFVWLVGQQLARHEGLHRL